VEHEPPGDREVERERYADEGHEHEPERDQVDELHAEHRPEVAQGVAEGLTHRRPSAEARLADRVDLRPERDVEGGEVDRHREQQRHEEQHRRGRPGGAGERGGEELHRRADHGDRRQRQDRHAEEQAELLPEDADRAVEQVAQAERPERHA
jgi:hypothetical protein